MKLFIYVALLLLFFHVNSNSQGFLKTQGTKIVNGNNEEVLLKGIGLGGWLVQEGYMLQTGKLDAEHQIREGIKNLVGEEKTKELYQLYHKNYVREIDVDNITQWGFNSIRLPLHWNKLILQQDPLIFSEEGFQQIDSLLSWCEKNHIYLILDLHAAPGGQSAGGIADYDNTKPSLWESEANKYLTVEIWREIAKRYVNEEWIGGYDLINEPAWDLGTNAPALRDLYIRITDVIRAIDTNHIIFIEGNWWATTFDGLTPKWDDNMVYSFHKYWNSNDQGSIQYLLNLRDNANTPLWLGETGENSNTWFLDCVELMKKNNIGWAWWPHKKIDNISGPLSAYKLPQYQQVLDYWNGNGTKPSELFAYAALKGQFDYLKFENCKFQPDVIDALIRQVDEKSTIPYKNNSIPGRIYASDYDIGPRQIAYSDVEYQNTGANGARVWNNGWAYRNDGVDIENCTDQSTNGFSVGWIETGEWLKYTIDVTEDGKYDLDLRYASTTTTGKVIFALDGINLTSFIDIPNSGGWQTWKTLKISDISLPIGKHELTVKFYFGGFNINYFEFTKLAVDVENEKSPNTFKLNQNYPNPFNPSTIIEYSLPVKSNVQLKIIDIVGNVVAILIDEERNQGEHKLNLDFNKIDGNISSGVYFYVLKANDLVSSKKMLYLK